MNIFLYINNIKNDLKLHGYAYIITDILFKIFAVLIGLPLAHFVFSYFLNLYGSAAVSNTDVINFIFSPLGVMTIFFGNLAMLTLFFAEHVVLMAIAFASQNNQKIRWVEAFNLLRQKIKPLLFWGGGVIIVAIITLTPIFFAITLLYSHFITAFDINYYLQEKPKEFIQFLSFAAPLGIFAVFWAGYLYISTLFTLPIILFEPMQGFISLFKTAHRRLYGRFRHMAFSILLWWGLLFIIAIIYQLIIKDFFAEFLFSFNENSPNWVLSVMTTMFFLEIGFDIIWQLVATVGVVIIVIHVYVTQAQENNIKLVNPSMFDSRFAFPIRLKRLSLLAAPIILIIAAYFSYDLTRSINIDSSMDIIAHRGSSIDAPPNSRAAFLQAIEDGTDYIELDVQETKDGVVIVHHDKDYKLTSNLDAAVHTLTWEETKHIDVGKSFSAEFEGETVLSLEQLLDLAKGKVDVVIELKYYGYNQNLEQSVVDLVNKADMQKNVRYMSLNLEGMLKIKQLDPSAIVGYISSAAKIGNLAQTNVDFIAISPALITQNLIKRVHNNNKTVAVWTVDDVDEMMRYLNLRVDALITNKPKLLAEVIEQRKEMSKAELFISFYYHYWENTKRILKLS